MGEGPKRAQHQYNWLEIRRDHAKGLSFRAIARKHKVRLQTVLRRAKLEGWAQQNEALTQQATREAIKDEAQKVAEAVGESLTDILAAQAPLASAMIAYAKKMLDDGAAGAILPGYGRGPADVFAAIIQGAEKAGDFGRQIAGLRPGQPSVKGEADDENGKEYIVAIRPEDSDDKTA